MEKEWIWYLSGAMDTGLSVRLKIRKDDGAKVGYTIVPFISYSRPSDVESVFGLLDEYSEELGIQYRTEESNDQIRFVVTGAEDCREFLKPLLGGFIQQQERTTLFLNEFLPHFEDGPPQSEEEFIEVMEIYDNLKDYPLRGRKKKYDLEYFRDEWGL